MESQTKTETTMLDKIKAYLKRADSFLFKSDDEIDGGYTDLTDIPEPNIDNFPTEGEFFNQADRILSQIQGKARINMTKRNKVENDKEIDEQAENKRKQIKMQVNEQVNENIR